MSSKVSIFGAKAPTRFIKIDLEAPGGPSMTPEQEQLLKSFMLQSVHLDASLNEFASHGSLTFVFKNPVVMPVEMRFAFPLMDGGAVITGITAEWDGQRISGRVRASEEGKREYSDAITKGHTASLVEHAENDLFLWRVGGIPGGSTVTVVAKMCGPVVMSKRLGKKPRTEITLTVPAVVPPWYGKADSGDAALAFDTAVQAPASIGGLALALPPFTATVRSHFITESLKAVTVTSPTHGPPEASSVRSSDCGVEVTFRDLFKTPAGGKAATNLQMRWVAEGIVSDMACVGRMLAGAGQLNAASSGADVVASQDADGVEAMEAAAAALAAGPLGADAQALLEKTKTQQRKMEQVCGVLYSNFDGKQPEAKHVTVLVDCSGSMYPRRIGNARKAVRALLTSLDPASTFAVYLFGSDCRPVVLRGEAGKGGPVYEASPDNVKGVANLVDAAHDMGGTQLHKAVEIVLRDLDKHLQAGLARRHNIMILTDGEVGEGESAAVKEMLAQVCPVQALVGIIGIGNEVTRTTLRKIVEGGLGPQALMFDNESEESIATIVLGSISALLSSELRKVNWPGGRLVGSQALVQCNSSEVCAAWALYPEARPAPQTPAAEDEEWEVVAAHTPKLGGAPSVRWLGGASVSVVATQERGPVLQLPTLLVTDEEAVKSMCIAAALARCRHPSCPRQEATKLALRYGFVCAEADSVMVAVSEQPAAASSSSFGIAIPSHPVRPTRHFPASASAPRSRCFGGGSSSSSSGSSGKTKPAAHDPHHAMVTKLQGLGFSGFSSSLAATAKVDLDQKRPKANVVVALDVSSSMLRGSNFDIAKTELNKLWNLLEKGDSLTIITFSSTIQEVVHRRFKCKLKEGQVKRETQFDEAFDIRRFVSNLKISSGTIGTALYDAVTVAMQMTQQAAKKDEAKAERPDADRHTYQLLVIAGGEDDSSKTATAASVNQILRRPGVFPFSSCFVAISAQAAHALAPCTAKLKNSATVFHIDAGFGRLTESLVQIRPTIVQKVKKVGYLWGGGAELAAKGLTDNVVTLNLDSTDSGENVDTMKKEIRAQEGISRSPSLSPPPKQDGTSSLLDVLGALHGASWSLSHPAVVNFLAKHMPSAVVMCTSDDLVTVAVIVVLRASFKGSKSGWHAHVKRAARRARAALGDFEYSQHKAALLAALKP